MKSQPDSQPTDGKFSFKRLLPLLAIVAGFVAFFWFGLDRYLSFQALRDNRELLLQWRDENYLLAAMGFAGSYAILTGFSVPAGMVLTLTGGFMFGTVAGGFFSLGGACVGATAIFLAARYAVADMLRAKAGPALVKMETGFRANEMNYMLVLRLVPLFPFWLVNLVPALLNVSTRVYIIGTVFGMIPGVFVYASVGNGLSMFFENGGEPDLGIIFAPEILIPIIGLAILALVPVAYRKFSKSHNG